MTDGEKIAESIGEIGSNISELVESAVNSGNFRELNEDIKNTVGSFTAIFGDAVNGFISGMTEISSGNGTATSDRIREGIVKPTQEMLEMLEKAEKRKLDPSRFLQAGTAKTPGFLLAIFGGIGTCGFGLLLLLRSLLSGGRLAFFPLLLTAACIAVIVMGIAKMGAAGRFACYARTIGDRNTIGISELAAGIGRSEKFVSRELRKMVEKGWFKQGHVDPAGETLFLTDESYHSFAAEVKQINAVKQQKEVQKQKEAAEQKAEEKKLAELTPEVRQLLAEGKGYITKIRESNERIEDPSVTAKLDDLEKIVSRIFQYVAQYPESAKETKKLMKYYLPTTIRLLDAYEKLNEQPNGKNVASTKKEIEATLDTLNEAFGKLFDNLYQDHSMEIRADIQVLNTLLATEGLTEKASL